MTAIAVNFERIISEAHAPSTPVLGRIFLPSPRRARSPQNPNPGRTLVELRKAAPDLNKSAITNTGNLATLRALKRDIGVGQDPAPELRDWHVDQPIDAANGNH